MIIDISENDIINIIPNYDPNYIVTDYTDNSGDGRYGYGLTGKFDMDVILKLLKFNNSKNIFEIGTWFGRTTRIFALNLDTVYTLDCPKEWLNENNDLRNTSQYQELLPKEYIGFASNNLSNVVQFYGDSADIATIRNIRNHIGHYVDAVFIDGNHTYNYVLSDTLTAMSMVNKDGLIIWHDVKDDDSVDVKKALIKLPITVYHIVNTWVGFFKNS